MDDRLIRKIFSENSSATLAFRWPLEILPTYTTVFGKDDRPAGIVLAITSTIVAASLVGISVRIIKSKTLASAVMWCFFALSVLSASISLPMAGAKGSTLRSYTLITSLIAQVATLSGDGKISAKGCALHVISLIQLAILPGTWSRLDELAYEGPAFAVFLIVVGYVFLAIGGVCWVALGLEEESKSSSKDPTTEGKNASKILNEENDTQVQGDGAHVQISKQRDESVAFVVVISAINFFYLVMLRFY